MVTIERVEEGVSGGYVKARCPICQKTFAGKTAHGVPMSGNDRLWYHIRDEHPERVDLDAELGTSFLHEEEDKRSSSLCGKGVDITRKAILKDVEERVLAGDARAVARHFEAWSWSWSGVETPQGVKSFLERCGRLASGEVLPGESFEGELI